MLQRGLCKSIRSIQHDEHKPETRGRRSSTSNSIMRKVQRRRRGPELATLQSLNNCNVEPRATRTYGDLRTKVCERTFFSSGSSEGGEDACWPKSEDQPTFCNVESYVHIFRTSIDQARNVPILVSRPSSSRLDVSISRDLDNFAFLVSKKSRSRFSNSSRDKSKRNITPRSPKIF